MIGTYGTSPYKYADDFKMPSDYLSYLADADGWYCRFTLDKQKYVRESFHHTAELARKNRYYGVPDCYISMNSFLSPHSKRGDKDVTGRKNCNIKHLNALFVDFDCYNKGYTPEQALYVLEEDYFGAKIPVPTFVIFSGRGLYCIWKINEDRNALPRWNRVQSYLIDACAELGADPAARDAARVLRVPFTINSKNGATVQIARFSDISYTLHEIITEYDIPATVKKRPAGRKDGNPTYPYGQATEKQRRTAMWIANALELPLPKFEDFAETAKYIETYISLVPKPEKRGKIIDMARYRGLSDLASGRISDLFKLMSLRKGENCAREIALFLCRLFSFQRTHDSEAALSAALSLNSSLDAPFDDAYVRIITKTAETHADSYNYKNETLLKILRVTEDEQKELEYITRAPKTPAEAKKRANRRAYLSRLAKEGKTTKKTAVQERREQIALLMLEGKTKDDIVAALGISARTYDRDKAAIAADGLLGRVKAHLEAVAKNVAGKIQNASNAVKQGVESVVDAAKKSIRRTSPKIQSPYYRRKGETLSAGASPCESPPIQLSLFDFLPPTELKKLFSG